MEKRVNDFYDFKAALRPQKKDKSITKRSRRPLRSCFKTYLHGLRAVFRSAKRRPLQKPIGASVFFYHFQIKPPRAVFLTKTGSDRPLKMKRLPF